MAHHKESSSIPRWNLFVASWPVLHNFQPNPDHVWKHDRVDATLAAKLSQLKHPKNDNI